MVKNMKAFPLTKQAGPLLPFLFKVILEVWAMKVREEKEIKEIQINKEAKLSLFEDDMPL